MADEDSYHATVGYTKARALRNCMRKYWNISKEEWFAKTGPDWLLVLLNNLNKNVRAQVMLILWRAWFLREDIVHGKGKATVKDSVFFLKNYNQNLNIEI
jgi:hypothetical protein